MNAFAQNNRLNNYNTIGWYNYSGTFKLSDKIGIHTEYQWRRADLIAHWQQGVARVGLNYKINPRVQFRLGYAFVETFAYGEIPINGLGRAFSEHRVFQMAQIAQKEGIVDISHRFILEQRFVGRYKSAASTQQDEFPFTNRIRYMLRLQIPLKGTEIKDKTPYIALYDEVLIGFGDNVNANVFDQNRIGVLLGYRINPMLRLEAGFLNQTAQLGRLVNAQNVFQYNNGLIVNAHFDFDVSSSNL